MRPAPVAPRPVPPAPAPKHGAPMGSLAGAFRSAVEREEEPSSPLDVGDLRSADEWYVAINAVPVGPILIAEVRRKAALGVVTEDSLAWQDGLDEWRPIRAFPELAATVREAAQAGRGSLVPPPPPSRAIARLTSDRLETPAPYRAPPSAAGAVPHAPPSAPHPIVPSPATAPLHRAPTSGPQLVSSSPNPPPAAPHAPALESRAPATPPGTTPTAGTAAGEPASAVPAAAPVVATPIHSEPRPHAVVSDPFKVPAPAIITSAAHTKDVIVGPARPPFDSAALRAEAEPGIRPTRGTPWLAIAMIAAAMAFGSTAAVVLFLPRVPQSPDSQAARPPAGTAALQVIANPTPTGAPSDKPAIARDTPPVPSTQADSPRRVVASPQPSKPVVAVAAASASARPIDMRSLLPSAIGAIPTDDTTESSKAPGQCQSEAQVQSVIAQHQTAIRRTCWERNQTEKPAASIAITLTIGPDGNPQGVSATGDDPAVAKCIESDLHSWHFPAMGCSQKTAFSIKFVRQ